MTEQPLLTGMKPYLNLAAICERYIAEADGALTLFRIVDRFTVGGTAQDMPPTQVTFNLIVSFRAGDFRGPIDLGLQIISPSKARVQELKIPVNFEAPDEKASNMIGQINLLVREPGLYWIVVKLLEEEYTRVPFRIVYQRAPTVQAGN